MFPAVEFYVESSVVGCCLLDIDHRDLLLGDPDNSNKINTSDNNNLSLYANIEIMTCHCHY